MELHGLEREATRYKSTLSDVVGLASMLDIKGTSDIQRQITLAWKLKLAFDAVQYARMAAGDPIAWISALTSGIGAAVSLGSEVARQTASAESPQ